ncbi:hypothetical protein NTG1052_630002 [Candidatus Nitrotoga sp. 1052]|nr:hypothetical protein NTG1052_630002 [Candidatus Nitrotoga sp. 1052]
MLAANEMLARDGALCATRKLAESGDAPTANGSYPASHEKNDGPRTFHC